jgi:hypothetical protein
MSESFESNFSPRPERFHIYKQKLADEYPPTWRRIIKIDLNDENTKAMVAEIQQTYEDTVSDYTSGTEEFEIHASISFLLSVLLKDGELDSGSQDHQNEIDIGAVLGTLFKNADPSDEAAFIKYCRNKAFDAIAELTFS